MGGQVSTLTGLGLTEANAYVKARKQSAKEYMAAHKELAAATAAYSEALKGAGNALVVFCEGTSIFDGSALSHSSWTSPSIGRSPGGDGGGGGGDDGAAVAGQSGAAGMPAVRVEDVSDVTSAGLGYEASAYSGAPAGSYGMPLPHAGSVTVVPAGPAGVATVVPAEPAGSAGRPALPAPPVEAQPVPHMPTPPPASPPPPQPAGTGSGSTEPAATAVATPGPAAGGPQGVPVVHDYGPYSHVGGSPPPPLAAGQVSYGAPPPYNVAVGIAAGPHAGAPPLPQLLQQGYPAGGYPGVPPVGSQPASGIPHAYSASAAVQPVPPQYYVEHSYSFSGHMAPGAAATPATAAPTSWAQGGGSLSSSSSTGGSGQFHSGQMQLVPTGRSASEPFGSARAPLPPSSRNSGQLVVASSAVPMGFTIGDKKLDELARQLSTLFMEAAAQSTPLLDLLAMGDPILKTTTPLLTVEAARGPDGQMETLGRTMQKLVNWERHLKKEVKALEGTRSDLKKNDRSLQKHSDRAARKDPARVDPRKVQGAQAKVAETQQRLASATQAVGEVYSALEHFKLELLLPQIVRLLPLLVALWGSMARMHDHQQRLASALAAQVVPPPATRTAALGFAATGRSSSESSMVAAGGGGGGSFHQGSPLPLSGSTSARSDNLGVGVTTSKAQHDATKKLEDAFKKWHGALSAFNQSQRKYCSTLTGWVRKTMSVPGSFPKPQQGPPQQQQGGQYAAPWSAAAQQQREANMQVGPALQTAHSSFVALCNDWTRTVDNLPEAEVKDAVLAMCQWLSQAYDLQSQEMKQAKKVDEANKLLSKADQKLELVQQRERELQLALGTPPAPGHEKDRATKEQQAQQVAADVAVAKSAADVARAKMNQERVVLERLVLDGRVAAQASLQQGLPVVFDKATKFATVAAQAFLLLKAQHAPWLQ